MEPERGFEPANLPITSRLRYQLRHPGPNAAGVRGTRIDRPPAVPGRDRPSSIGSARAEGQRAAGAASETAARGRRYATSPRRPVAQS